MCYFESWLTQFHYCESWLTRFHYVLLRELVYYVIVSLNGLFCVIVTVEINGASTWFATCGPN